MERNRAKARLESGAVAVGTVIRRSRTIDIALIMDAAGYDFLFIDFEHNPTSLETVSDISIACLSVGIAPIVRVSSGDYDTATRMLDSGALGIIMPHVDTVEEAEQFVRRMRYPPEGTRSCSATQAMLNYRQRPMDELKTIWDDNLLLAVMLESKQAVANADAIAAIPGIDVVMIGTNDLAMDIGVHGDPMHEAVQDSYCKVIAATRKHGKWAGCGGINAPDSLKHYIAMGLKFISTGDDTNFLLTAARQRADMVRKFEMETKG